VPSYGSRSDICGRETACLPLRNADLKEQRCRTPYGRVDERAGGLVGGGKAGYCVENGSVDVEIAKSD